MASTVYTPLDASKNQIRLARLHAATSFEQTLSCDLEVVSLDSEPHYEALSYVWGDAAIRRPMMLGGMDWNVTHNLDNALRHLRSNTEEKIIWVDAICIDQSNVSERNSQIRLMGDVFRKAQMVRIWLGEEADGSDDALSMLSQLQQGIGVLDVRINDTDLTSGHLDSMHKLCERPWWRRIWVIQEVVLARRAVMHCGSQHLSVTIPEITKIYTTFTGSLSPLLKRMEFFNRFGDHNLKKNDPETADHLSLSHRDPEDIPGQYFVGRL